MNILDWGIVLIEQLQSIGSWLTAPMLFFTFLGNEEFYLLVAPAIYWCWNAELGLRLGVYVMLSSSLNNIAKLTGHSPRPFWYSSNVSSWTTETSFGFPSGHAQNSTVMWGALAFHLHTTWAMLFAVLIILAIGISRIYLGVHFPTDVIGGWLIGVILLGILLRYEHQTLAWLQKFSFLPQIGMLFGFSVGIVIAAFLVQSAWNAWVLPSEWIANYDAAALGQPLVPFNLDNSITGAGAFFGLAAGAVWIQQRGGFNPAGSFRQRLLRYLIGISGVLLLWAGLGSVFPRNLDLVSFSLRFLRYTLIGVWITALAPLAFQSFGLAGEVRA